MDRYNPFLALLGLLILVAIVIVVSFAFFYPIEAFIQHSTTPADLEKVESLRRDISYYQKVEGCIPPKTVADIHKWNKIILIRRNPHKIAALAIPDSWKSVEPIEFPKNLKLCN